MFLSAAVFMLLLQGIMAFPFQVVTAEAKESKKYYEEEEEDDEDERYEKYEEEEYFAQPAGMPDDARQHALEQQRQRQQYMIEQQALFEQQLLAQRRAIEERQRQLEEQSAAQVRAVEEQELLAAQQADADLALFSDTDHDGIADAADPHPGEHEAVYAVSDDNKNGISDELEHIHALARR